MRITAHLVLIVTAALFAAAHWFFLRTYLYWEYDHLDIFMHLWGGGLVMAVWYGFASFLPVRMARSWKLPLTMLCAAIILWEIFKYAIGGIVMDNYAIDTVIDVFAGLGGGLVVFLVQRSRTIRSS